MTVFPPQDVEHFPAGRYVLVYADNAPQGGVLFLERWEAGRPVVSGAIGTWALAVPAVRMASSHATFADGQTARLAVCPEEHLSEGELRARCAAWERELPWAPPTERAEEHRAWWARTAPVRLGAERADGELRARGIDRSAEPKVTAAQWLADHGLAQGD